MILETLNELLGKRLQGGQALLVEYGIAERYVLGSEHIPASLDKVIVARRSRTVMIREDECRDGFFNAITIYGNVVAIVEIENLERGDPLVEVRISLGDAIIRACWSR